MDAEVMARAAPSGHRLESVLAHVAAVYRALDRREVCPTDAALGRILAEDVAAAQDLPPFDAAAMDGFAVPDEAALGQVYRIAGQARAGHPWPAQVAPGTAVQILTGACVPAGTRRVVMHENCEAAAGRLRITAPGGPRDHIRRRGEDVRAGATVLHRGQRIGPGELALISALGLERLPMVARVRVTLISTGDELARTSPLRPGQIADANGPMLRAELQAMGCDVAGPIVLRDDARTILSALIAAAPDSDLIVTTGGASSGETDHFARLIGRRGALEFWKLAMKPGRPVALGDIDDCPILCLPGNPVAAAVTWRLIGMPLVARLSGARDVPGLEMTLPLATAVRGTPGKLVVLAACLTARADGSLAAQPLARQGSGNLMAQAGADGWIVLPETGADLPEGAPVRFLPTRASGPFMPSQGLAP